MLQDKEEKERQMNSRAAVEETAEDRALNSIGLEEEIIELQDLRMSPIPSLRNRHKAKYYKEPGGRLHGMCPSIIFHLFQSVDVKRKMLCYCEDKCSIDYILNWLCESSD